MKKKILFTLALTILAALSPACGMIHDNFGRTGTTTLNIVVETPEKFSNLTWPIVSQIMVYIVGAPGTDYKVAVPITISPGSTATGQTVVPNGVYHGYALAWDGANLTGTVGCWKDVNPHSPATGGAQTVNIKITNTTTDCDYSSASGPFGPSSYASGSNFTALANYYLCYGGTVTSAATCGTNGMTNTAAYGSMMVILNGYTYSANQVAFTPGNNLSGACAVISAGASTNAAIVPVGLSAGQDTFLATTILLFAGGSCSGTAAKVIRFNKGLISGSLDGASVISPTAITINVGS